jgi:hypothetical protein
MTDVPFDPAALSPNDSQMDLRGNLDRWMRLNVLDDGTPTSGWPNRWEIWNEQALDELRIVAWFNERGEFRCIPAKENTVAWALYIKELPTDPNHHTTNVWQILDNRTDRNVMLGVDSLGKLVGANAPDATYGPWTTIPLDPTFAAASGGGYRAPEIRSAPGGMLQLRGRMSSVGAWVANTSVLGTIPATDANANTLRPTAIAQLLIRASSTMANLIINTDGTIVSAQAVTGGSNASIEGLQLSK